MDQIKNAKKAIGALLVGLLGWGTAVVTSESSSITSSEWIAAATVAVTVIVTYFLTNDPLPEKPAEIVDPMIAKP